MECFCHHLTVCSASPHSLLTRSIKTVTQEKILQILWAIHNNARSFFSVLVAAWEEGNPQSGLRHVVAFLRTGLIMDVEHCPVERILGAGPAQMPVCGASGGGGGDPF